MCDDRFVNGRSAVQGKLEKLFSHEPRNLKERNVIGNKLDVVESIGCRQMRPKKGFRMLAGSVRSQGVTMSLGPRIPTCGLGTKQFWE
jgi:hypothetical protein